eukprot:6121222-Lingulodinium_polyedra.AAC.1
MVRSPRARRLHIFTFRKGVEACQSSGNVYTSQSVDNVGLNAWTLHAKEAHGPEDLRIPLEVSATRRPVFSSLVIQASAWPCNDRGTKIWNSGL